MGVGRVRDGSVQVVGRQWACRRPCVVRDGGRCGAELDRVLRLCGIKASTAKGCPIHTHEHGKGAEPEGALRRCGIKAFAANDAEPERARRRCGIIAFADKV